MSIEEIEKNIQNYLSTPRPTKENLKDEIKNLNSLVKHWSDKIDSIEKEYKALSIKSNSQVMHPSILNNLATIDNIKSLLNEMKKINNTIIDQYRHNRLKYMNYKWNISGTWGEVPTEILNIPSIIDSVSNNLNSSTQNLKIDQDSSMQIVNSTIKKENEIRTHKMEPVHKNQKGLTSKLKNEFEDNKEDKKLIEMSKVHQEHTKLLKPEFREVCGDQKPAILDETEKTKDYHKELLELKPQALLEEMSSDEIRNVITKAILPGYWSFWGKEYSYKDIFIILKLAEFNNPNTLIFYGNPNFNEECGLEYKKFLEKTKSIRGIDLYCLNFSKRLKLDFLDLFKNENIKYLIMEKEEFDEKKINEKVKNLNLKLDSTAAIKFILLGRNSKC